MEKFWVCWNPKKGYPSMQHLNLEEAKVEAERISKKENNQVLLLECIGGYRPTTPPVEFFEAT